MFGWMKNKESKSPEDCMISELFSVHELDRFGGYVSSQMVHLRKSVPILIVDDTDAQVIKKALEKYDFRNVETATERPSDKQVQEYPIIITDICGIGQDLHSNGLLFAEHIKECFPLKQVIVISGQMKSGEYKKNISVVSKVDGLFKKGDSYDALSRLLEPCLCRVSDPALVWRLIRQELLLVKGAEKKDTEIGKVALWEDQFVRQFLEVGRDVGGDAIKRDWISEMMRAAALAGQVVTLLNGIKALC